MRARGPEGCGDVRVCIAPRSGKHRVVWWDPAVLELDKQDDVGLRQQRILAADEGAAVATEGERLHAEWQARRVSLARTRHDPLAPRGHGYRADQARRC